VIGGAPTNIAKTYRNVNDKFLARLNVWAMLGIMNAFPEMNEWMRDDLRTDAYQDKRFLLELTSCSYASPTLAKDLQFANISAMFERGDHFLTEFSKTLDDIGVMGRNITEQNNPKYNLAFFYGTEDEVTYPLEDTEKLIAKWKTAGKVQKVTDWPLAGRDHTSALLPGMCKAFNWMSCQFDEAEKGEDMHCDKQYKWCELIQGYRNQMSFTPSQELR
jgi:triacylglycerol lipase